MGRGRSAEIANKAKRLEVFQREKAAKKREKKRLRQKELVRDGGEVGSEEVAKKRPRTLESTREVERTRVVDGDMDEVLGDEADDELASETPPKVLLTTRPKPSRELFKFAADLVSIVPNMFFYPRRHFNVKQICKFASNKQFSHVIVLSEKAKRCNGLLVAKLPVGPTAFFKVSNVQLAAEIHGGRKTDHEPEILLNNFTTRLGRRVGRFLGSLFPSTPQFQGRQAVTFHNQRDYIFVRHHRYIFEQHVDKPVLARLQELGPRFTLRLRWLQDGVFDSQFGEFEWYHRRKEMDTSRRKFHL
mmetsp:Transcript_6055/g.18251  ORF Transcript_6055/g.18251 Transcript_6055/m.18251 type:complete len:302 (-) Transcript_6055:305-1210(-)